MAKSSKKNEVVRQPEIVNKNWFEMKDFSGFVLKKKVWVPLRVSETASKGIYGHTGFSETFFGLRSVAIPTNKKIAAKKLDWQDLGISHSSTGFYDDNNGVYIPADHFRNYKDDLQGLHLVLEIPGNGIENPQWEPLQDFVVTLGLIRENDAWLSPSEGYIDVLKLYRDHSGDPVRMEVNADHLTDYLCARGMGLCAIFYTSRSACYENDQKMGWKPGKVVSQKEKNGRWEGREWPIHEGGHPYGEKMAIFHLARTDADETEDMPDLSDIPSDENTKSESWEKGFDGEKLYKVMGEFWGTEWLDPAKISRRVKDDKVPSTFYYSIDEKGTKINGDKLAGSGKWLWFKPDVIMALTQHRGGSLKWYTRNTGEVSCSPHYGVHFGINNLSLVNVFAKDVGFLPEWQQRIWSGYNTPPDGGVSAELLASQVKAEPAKTQAPEQFLAFGIKTANHFAQEKLGVDLFNYHDAIPEIIEKTNRFRAIDKAGLFALAKDIARVTADSINESGIKRIAPPPKGKDFRSLKSLEFLLATKIGDHKARITMAPLFNVYDLRLGDAHLPTKDIDEALLSLRIDKKQPFVYQGSQMLHAVVSSIYKIIYILKNWDNGSFKELRSV